MLNQQKDNRMKKTTLMMLASASILLATPATNALVTSETKTPTHTKSKMCTKKERMMHRGANAPFLIKKGLPKMMRMIKPYMNDPDFALTAEQKAKLQQIKAQSRAKIMKMQPEVMQLKQEIIKASKMGKSAKSLEKKVGMLAVLEARATMTQLECIEATKHVLSKEQIMFLLMHKKSSKVPMMKYQGMKGRQMGMGKMHQQMKAK